MTPANKNLAFKYAQESLPKEACGVVVICKGRELFMPCRNLSTVVDRFEIHPDDYAAAEELGEIVEIFHSHPYRSPRPSMVDKLACEATNLKWSIVSVPNGDWFEFQPSGYRAPLIGREWAHGLADCYELLRDYYRETLSIELPHFDRQSNWWRKGDDLFAKNFASSGFREVPHDEIQKHDILLLQVGATVINHGGVYLGDGLFIHHVHGRLSTRDPFGGYWAKHLRKVVRHHSL